MNEKSVTFSLSLLFPWIKGRVGVTEQFVELYTRNKVLGFIPAGGRSENMPLHNISSVYASRKYSVKAIIGGIVVIFIGFMLSSYWYGIVLMLLGILGILNSIETRLTIQRAGTDLEIDAPFYEKKKIALAQSMISEELARSYNDFNVRMQREASDRRADERAVWQDQRAEERMDRMIDQLKK